MSCERYEGSGWWTGEGDETDLDNNCAAVRDDSGGGNDLSSAIEAWTQVFDAFDVCSYFKFNNNGFRCFDKPKPPSTKEQAIEQYNSEYPPETICLCDDFVDRVGVVGTQNVLGAYIEVL